MSIFRWATCAIIYLFIVLCFSSSAVAATVYEYRLSNGLKILVEEDHRVPIASFQIWYKIGGSYENSLETGISHVIEHMMFKSTKNYPAGAFTRLITQSGGERNAGTRQDYTYYYANIVTDKLPLMFKLEADRMQNIIFKPAEFKRELQVIMEERRFRVDNQPLHLLRERLKAISFLTSPYRRPNIGWMSDIKNMTLQKSYLWYKAWYTPNNATIVVVGDVQHQQIFAYAKQYFGQIPAKILPILKLAKDVPVLGPRSVSVNIPSKYSELMMAFNVPVAATAKPAWETYALIILNNLLSGSSNSRLKRQLIDKQLLAKMISSSYLPFTTRLDNLFYIYAIPAKGKSLTQLKIAIRNELDYYQSNLIPANELNLIKIKLIARQLYDLDSIEARAKQLGMLETLGLSWKTLNDYEKNIQQVTAEQIRSVARRYLAANRTITGKLIPQKN